MIAKRNYYYLISGLPDILLEQSKAPFSLDELLAELQATLHPEDFALVRFLFLPNDNRNLLNLTLKREAPWDQLATFSREELEEGLKEPGQLPAYMDQFYQAYRLDAPLWKNLSWEHQLTRLYYDFALEQTEGFLHAWLTFDRTLKNILAAWNARTYELPLEGQLIGNDDVTAVLYRSQARDFGLSRDVAFIEPLLHALERDDLLERERAVDHLRWNYIDELNTFHYFSLEVVLGYLLKFLMLERWLKLNPERGKQALRDRIQVLEDSVGTQPMTVIDRKPPIYER